MSKRAPVPVPVGFDGLWCPVDGLALSEHPPSTPPCRAYTEGRKRLRPSAVPLPWPDLSDVHRRAIQRARRERQGVAPCNG